MIAELEKLVAASSGVALTPSPPADDVKVTNLSNVTLSSPPDYPLGQKVLCVLSLLGAFDFTFFSFSLPHEPAMAAHLSNWERTATVYIHSMVT